ncbi:penicillin-binding protein 1A [Alphaproteobacteria bacterium]|nr:penicillin-binding protein 1A [Alphaproteobacteria bacterium]
MPSEKKNKEKKVFPPKTRRFSYVRTFFMTFFRLSLSTAFLIGAFSVGALWWLNKSLPPLQQFSVHVRTPSVTIQAVDGTILATYGDSFEEFVQTQDLPEYVVKAFLSVEDRRFFQHSGIDPIGILRAAVKNYKAHRIVQGGSTLTQQLAKNMLMAHGLFSRTDRSIKRKLQELILSIKLESYFSKQEILTIYLNRVYFGAGTYGIDAASRRYFHKSATQLTLFEAAILAGLLRAPSRYSPTSNPKKAIGRAHLVLRTMEANAFIEPNWKEQVAEWEKSFLEISAIKEKGCRYFADWIYESLPSLMGPIDEDLTVVTTLQTDMQHKAEQVCSDFHKNFGAEYKYAETAALLMTPSGAILAMVGGLDYGKSQFNRVTTAQRQPGSSFKTFVYLTALEKGMDHDEKFDDSPFQIGSWKPGNFKWKSLGEISFFEAFVYSVNSVCLRIVQKVGIREVIKTTRRLGFTSRLNADLTLALGTGEVTMLEMVRAYAPFANNGDACLSYGVLEIRNKKGEILYQHTPFIPIKVIEQKALDTMKTMLRTVVARGTGGAANVDPYIWGKTGTNGNRDAWFVGGRFPVLVAPQEPKEKESNAADKETRAAVENTEEGGASGSQKVIFPKLFGGISPQKTEFSNPFFIKRQPIISKHVIFISLACVASSPAKGSAKSEKNS